jgi:hypothetical protein
MALGAAAPGDEMQSAIFDADSEFHFDDANMNVRSSEYGVVAVDSRYAAPELIAAAPPAAYDNWDTPIDNTNTSAAPRQQVYALTPTTAGH